MKLEIELVPSTSWYNNVRSEVKPTVWNKIRKKCYEEANHVCEICGNSGLKQGRKHAVECHEIWEYSVDGTTHNQILTGFISLCPKCHELKHIGRTIEVKGHDYAIKNLAKVNNVSAYEALNQIENAFKIWQTRSQYQWNVDTTFINHYL